MDETNTPATTPPTPPVEQPVTPTPDNPHHSTLKWYGLAALILLLGLGAALTLYLKQHTTSPEKTINENTNPNPTPSPAPAIDPSEPLVSGMVDWVYPQPAYFKSIVKDPTHETNNQFYMVGTFKNGKYSGRWLLALTLPCSDLCTPAFVHAVGGPEFDSPLTILTKYSDPLDNIDETVVDKSRFVTDASMTISDLESPTTLTGPHGEQLKLQKIWSGFQTFNSTKLKPVYFDQKIGQIFTTPDNSQSVDRLYATNAFYAKSPDWNTLVYSLVIDFVPDTGIPNVTWSNGQKNSQQYDYTQRTGCGSNNFAAVVLQQDVNVQNDLIKSGSTSQGSVVYEFKDMNNKILKDIYENEYNPYDGPKLSYDQFIAKHPVFFWVDGFGRLIKFVKNEFQPQAECGKPVIYLYPTQTEAVKVKLDPAGGFKYTEPTYNDGWNVVAQPNGQLSVNGQTYPYLFWEGWGSLYQTPDKGFVVAQKDVDSFLSEKLALLGLNAKESADFKEYWEPYMTGSPYYFVTFMGNSFMDRIAPLTVNPKPDTVIRVLMDSKPLAQPVRVQGYEIKTPTRHGFTVVEWGGVKH